jgi:RES domain-containing protein
MLPPGALPDALQRVPLRSLQGPWYRAVNYEAVIGAAATGSADVIAFQPLWSGGAARQGARFTPHATGAAAINSLYCAEDPLTPLIEIADVLRPPGGRLPLRFDPQLLMTLDGELTAILDLTDVTIQQQLGTFPQELTGPWLVPQARFLAGQGPLPPTQRLAAEAFASKRVAGLRYPSAKHPQGVGVVIFSARLVPGRDELIVVNLPTGSLQQTLP